MHFNSSYRRGSGRYTTPRRVPPVQYEDPDIVLETMNWNFRRPTTVRQPSFQQTDSKFGVDTNEHSYMTIIA